MRIDFTPTNFIQNRGITFQKTSAAEILSARDENESGTNARGLRAGLLDSLNPLHSHTRLNAHNMQSASQAEDAEQRAEREWAEFSAMAERMGFKLKALSNQTYPLNFTAAFFESPCGNTENKILVRLADGRMVVASVPAGFTQRDFTNFTADMLPKLFEKHGLANSSVSASRLYRFFEEILLPFALQL